VPAKVEINGETARIILSGDFDFSTQGHLGDAINRALNSDVAKEIQVDMSAATFIDSSVIRALLKLQEVAKVKNKTLSIWNCSEQIREIFSIGGFDQMFVIH
jgi:anti-anti-sigma factor